MLSGVSSCPPADQADVNSGDSDKENRKVGKHAGAEAVFKPSVCGNFADDRAASQPASSSTRTAVESSSAPAESVEEVVEEKGACASQGRTCLVITK
jgi:hypothetical protein